MSVIKINKQTGSVSLFVVIFAALLILLVATAFIRIMLQDQRQATANDLSRSALDSAYAGVEDTKRAIVEYYSKQCQLATTSSSDCDALKIALGTGDWTTDCTAVPKLLNITNEPNMGFLLKEGTNNALDQAYTCIKVQMSPYDYLGSLTPSTSRIIKLQTTSDEAQQVTIEWYAMNDGQSVSADSGTSPIYQLPRDWPDDRPPVIKAQLLQFRNELDLDSFDQDMTHNSTLFLLPSMLANPVAGTPPPSFNTADHPKRDYQLGFAIPAECKWPNTNSTRYACSITINLPEVDGGNPTGNTPRTAYLKLSQFYNAANTEFRVIMRDAAGDKLRFKDVQPVVDSTGRANDLFRRIRSRIDVGVSSVPNPESAVDVSKSLCKIFAVTDSTVEATKYMLDGTCPSIP